MSNNSARRLSLRTMLCAQKEWVMHVPSTTSVTR